MSKKEQIDEVKEAGKMYREKTSLRGEMREAWIFIKFTIGFLFGLAIVGLGAAAMHYGYFRAPDLWHYVLIVAGACTFVDGWVVLWKVRKVK